MDHNSRHSEKTRRTVYLHAPTNVVETYDPKRIRIAKNLLGIHAFHPEIQKLEQAQAMQRLSSKAQHFDTEVGTRPNARTVLNLLI